MTHYPATPPPPAIIHSQAETAYSPRARRRLAALLRLKYLEMQAEHLEYVQWVIEHHLGVEELFKDPTLLPSGREHSEPAGPKS